MGLRFDGDPERSDLDEWLARVTPLLEADDPHQACNARAREVGCTVDQVCACPPPGPCTKECCVTREDDW